MANDNLDLRGKVDISVSGATSALGTLAGALNQVTSSQARLNDLTAGQSRAATTVAQNYKRMSSALVDLAKAYESSARAASIASDTQIKQSQAAAKAAEDSARRQTSAYKTAAAQQALGFNNTPLKTAAVPAVSQNIKPTLDYLNKVVAADKAAVDKQTQQHVAGYTAQFQAATKTDNAIRTQAIASARSEATARGQFAQQSFNQELAGRRRQLATMRQDAVSAFSNLPTLNFGDTGQLNQLRYQLYDIATAAGVVGTALLAAGGYAVKLAADYEAAFTTVARTTNQTLLEAQGLTEQLVEMSEVIPVNATDLAGVASLGAQLGIAEDNLASFTETTAKYAAVSGVSNEQVAQSFGAIFNLTDTGSENFERLASAINYVGIRSVATDAEILKMTQEISASTTQAGFAAEQTVGFAAALASLRIQPEQARGVVLRLFSDVDKAVSEGGGDLDAYAKQLGITSQAAADLWKSDPSGFTDRLVKTLSAADNVNGAIRALGITQTRETNVLQRLAGNYDTYAQSMQDAAGEYATGQFLAESYGKTQETLASQLKILANTAQNLIARAGASVVPIIKPIVEFATAVLQAFESIPAPIFAAITAFTLLAGAALAIVAAGAAGVGTLLALRAALTGYQSLTGQSTFSVKALAGAFTGLTGSMGLNAVATRVTTANLLNLTGSTTRATAMTASLAGANTAAATTGVAAGAGARAFGVGLLSIPFVNILAALSIIVPLVALFATNMNRASEEAKKNAAALLTAGGGIEAYTAAVQKDTAAAKGHLSGLTTITATLDKNKSSAEQSAAAYADRAGKVQSSLDVDLGMGQAADSTSAKLKNQTLVIGENAKAWVANSLAQEALNDKDSAIYKYFDDPQQIAAAKKYGIDISQAIQDGLGTKGGVEAELKRQFAAAEKAGAVTNKTTSMNTGAGGVGRVTTDYGNLKNSLTEVGTTVDATTDKLRVQQGVQDALGVSATQTGTDIDGMGDAGANAAEKFQVLLSANSNYASSLYSLQQSLDENGATFNEWSASGIANISALQTTLDAAKTAGAGMGLSAADSMVAALGSIDVSTDQIKSIVNTLAAANPTLFANMNIDDIIAKAQQVQQILKGAGFTTNASIGKDVLAAQQSKLSQLISQRDALQSQVRSSQNSADLSGNTGQKAAPKAKKAPAAPELKTTAEYASDIGSAMQEAFSKKFGVQQAMDAITSKFADLRDRIKEARLQVRSLNADLYKLASDRNILQIQLKVATDYGDTTRADAIRAELAQNSADTASKQKDLAKAIAAASTQLNGNTEAAIQNRGAVLDLLGAYQQQIQSYAATGASAAQVTAYAQRLRGEFVQQLTQLGYNSQSVKYYAGTFDTLTAAVRRVPTHKEVKVTADTSQAIGGLNSVGSRISGLSGQLSDLNAQIASTQARIENQKKANALNKQINDLTRQRTKLLGNGADNVAQRNLGQINSIQKQIEALTAQLNSLGYARGGMVGGVPGAGRSASRYGDDILANLKVGEGVVTLDGMKTLGGLGGLNAINNQQNPFPPVVINNSQNNNNSGTLVVELSPIDRQLIASGKNVQVTIGRDEVARAANAANLNTANRGANG